MEEQKKKKIRGICVDSLTEIQVNEYMTSLTKPTIDKWADYGKNIWIFVSMLQARGFELILVIGEPGTGKSSGMRTLPSKTFIWYNTDKKNPTWTGGVEEFGTKTNPMPIYHSLSNTYSDIISNIDALIAKGAFEDRRFAILTGHVEDFTSGKERKKRLKTLGALTNKLQMENKFEYVLYSKVEVDDEGKVQYLLETKNDGTNTARTPMGMFEDKIPNDYNLIIEKLLS